MPEPEEFWYRFQEIQYAAPLDEYERPVGRGDMKLYLHKIPVVRHTPRGVRLQDSSYPDGTRFVRREATKRYACPTIEEAKASFRARKLRQKAIHLARADQAQRAIDLIEGNKLWL